LAFAARQGEGPLRPVGLAAMEDPPRATAARAMAEARRAGIRTIMITGDNGGTAEAIAGQVGLFGTVITGRELDTLDAPALRARLDDVAVFARVSPEHKLRILDALREAGEIVAMTGDGVNDAPALRGAHVGIAMGRTGTEVAREAASIVLADDHFATIVSAVREGRRIYDNIRKFVVFLLRANFDEILLITTALLVGLPLPYLPLHILWINLMTDSLPALALGMEPAEPDVMERPPRPPQQGLLAGEWTRLAFAAVWAFAITLALYWSQIAGGAPLDEVRSVTLTMAILLELLLAQSVRSRLPLWRIGLRSNPWMLGAMAVPMVLHLGLLYSPLATVFHLAPLGFGQWATALTYAGLGFLVFELSKLVRH
jgi:Ca2+-transporting ATPase